MDRRTTLKWIAASLLTLTATMPWHAFAREKPDPTKVDGLLDTVSEDGKSIRVAMKGKKKDKKTPVLVDFRITNATRIEYVEFEGGDEQKLKPGYFVSIVRPAAGEVDVAVSIKVMKKAPE